MILRSHHQAFDDFPPLKGLERRFYDLEQQHPDLVLSASTPFLVHQDGSPYRKDSLNLELRPWDEVAQLHFFLVELDPIAGCIVGGRYDPNDLRYLCERGAALTTYICTVCARHDMQKVNRLREKKLLN